MDSAKRHDIQAAINVLVAKAAEKLPSVCQKRSLLNLLAEQVRTAAYKKPDNPESVAWQMQDAADWLDTLHRAANPLYGAPSSPTAQDMRKALGTNSERVKNPEGWIWSRPVLSIAARDGKDSSYYVNVDMDEISACAAAYLRAQWASAPQLEIMMAEMLVFAETLAFSDQMTGFGGTLGKRGRAIWRELRNFGPLFVVVLVAGSAWDKYGFAAGLLSGAAMYYFVASEVSPTRQRKVFDLLGEMLNVYQLLGQRPACPALIRERIYATSNAGVVWPAGLASLVEHAAVRNPSRWE